jgi:hypothetical protein
MCSPELTRGICCICFGSLTPDNTLHDDLNEGRGGVHRGKCAVLAGIYSDDDAAAEGEYLIRHMHNCAYGSRQHDKALKNYYAFVDRISTEDHDPDSL